MSDFPGPPHPEPALQRTKLSGLEPTRVATPELLEHCLRLQPRVLLQKRLDLRPHPLERVRARTPCVRHSKLARQPLPDRRYLRAVRSLIPAFAAAVTSGNPFLTNVISSLTCWSVVISPLLGGETLDDPANRPQTGSSECPYPENLIVVNQGDARVFRSGREFAAWLGLVPRHKGAGGRVRILGISKRGDTYLRTLLIHGVRSVLTHGKAPPQWALRLAERRQMNVAVVALANKTARTIWALIAHDRVYDQGFVSSPA